jgi:hypothetical protein
MSHPGRTLDPDALFVPLIPPPTACSRLGKELKMQLRTSRLILGITCWGALLLFGCGSGAPAPPKTVPVSGTVYLNGEPLAGAEVRFIREGFSSFGETGADGRFELVQGAVPGQNTVSVSKIEGGSGIELDPESGMDAGQLEAMRMGTEGTPGATSVPELPRQLIPAKYSDPSTSKLTYPVPEGGTTSADLRLTGG